VLLIPCPPSSSNPNAQYLLDIASRISLNPPTPQVALIFCEITVESKMDLCHYNATELNLKAGSSVTIQCLKLIRFSESGGARPESKQYELLIGIHSLSVAISLHLIKQNVDCVASFVKL
jgi:hypothetical protein